MPSAFSPVWFANCLSGDLFRSLKAGRINPKIRNNTTKAPSTCLPTSQNHGCSHKGILGKGSASTGVTNGALTTFKLSPRAILKPIASITRVLIRAIWASFNGVLTILPSASVVAGSSTSTATLNLRILPGARRLWLIVRSSSKLRVLRFVLEPGVTVLVTTSPSSPTFSCTACSGATPPPGGWLVRAPGTPIGPSPPTRSSSASCSLRNAAKSGL